MLKHELLRNDSILIVIPEDPLAAKDFDLSYLRHCGMENLRKMIFLVMH
jgi:hypothetical protein